MSCLRHSPVVAVQTPDWHSLALEADGTMWGWGSNDHGQLGNGSTNDVWSPGVVLWPTMAAPPAITLGGEGNWPAARFNSGFTNNPGFACLPCWRLRASLAGNWNVLGTAAEISAAQFSLLINDGDRLAPLLFNPYAVKERDAKLSQSHQMVFIGQARI